MAAVLGWAAAGAAAQASTTAASPARLNVILIVIDTLRADHLSAYGYTRRTSPNLDRLAAEGTLYENAISAASWTLPAHASLFTGLFVRDHRTTGNHWTLEPSYETLAEKLQGAGYRTGGFSNNVWTNDASGLKQGFDTFVEMWHEQHGRGGKISDDDLATDMGGAKTTERILGWLDGRTGAQPFFVFVNYFEPHLPYRPTRPFDDDFLSAGFDPGLVQRLRSFYSPREYGYILNVPWMRVTDRDLEVLSALYDGEIAYVDSVVATLVDGLRARHLLDNTLLVITSDHGEHLGEHHMLDHKLSVYDPLLKVPLILRAPGRVAAGVRVAGQVQAHDVFGTILELVGAADGKRRALPAAEAPAAFTFAELEYPQIFLDVIRKELSGWDASRFARGLTAVRSPRQKLIAGSDGSVELYDLIADPAESRDLAAAQPARVAELKRVLEAFLLGELPR